MREWCCFFSLHRRSPEDREAHLLCTVKWGRGRAARIALNVGYRIDPEKWEPRTKRCVPRSLHGPARIPAATINREMDRWAEAIAGVMGTLESSPTPGELRAKLLGALGLEGTPAPTGDTAQIYNAFFSEESVRCAWAEGTVKKMRTVKAHLLSYAPFTRMDGFTERNLSGYVSHLRSNAGLNDVTIHRHIGYLRWFLRWASEHGYLSDTGWTRFRPRFRAPEKPVIYLTWEELMRVWHYEAPAGHPYLNDVRDVFLFSCFTSLRYSDTQALRWADIRGSVIHIAATVKTVEALDIELNKWSDEIISRHVDRNHGDDHVLPQIPNQVLNRYLKRIARDCGIDAPVHLVEYRGSERTDRTVPKWELVGSHAGRRTFICNALMMGISPTVVMQWTGHSDYRAMRPYIAVADQSRRDAMAAFDKLNGDDQV